MLLRHILFMNYHRHSGTQCKTHPITYLFSPPSFPYIHLYVSGDVPDDTSPLCIHYKPINYPKRSILLHIIIVIIIFHFYDYYYWTGVRSPCGHRKSSFLLGNESTRCLFNIGEERKKKHLANDRNADNVGPFAAALHLDMTPTLGSSALHTTRDKTARIEFIYLFKLTVQRTRRSIDAVRVGCECILCIFDVRRTLALLWGAHNFRIIVIIIVVHKPTNRPAARAIAFTRAMR